MKTKDTIITLCLVVIGLVFSNCTKEENNPPKTNNELVVAGCDSFEKRELDLNNETIGFECLGNPFIESEKISGSNSNGSWGIFGGSIQLSYADNPQSNTLNNSFKVLKIKEASSNESWSGFFFDLKTPIKFEGKNTAISIQVFSIYNGQSVLLKLENSVNSSQYREITLKTSTENNWEQLTYNFSALDSGKYDRLVFIMNSTKNNTSETVYYLDSVLISEPVNELSVDSYTELVWSDEFDYQGRPDETKWHHQTFAPNNGSWFNEEAQHYVDREENSYVSDGSLKIAAIKDSYTTQNTTKEYTSARLNSKFNMTYGKIEVRAKLPSGAGTWPAIWTLGANINEPGNYYGDSLGSVGWPLCGEIDIMEQNGWDKTQVYGHFHWGNTQTGAYENHGEISNVSDTSTQYHTYTLLWNEQVLKIAIDNEIVVEQDNNNLNPFDNPHYLILNVAVGGTLGGEVPNDFGSELMEVDYVRFYQ